jgi:hypothetical protein
VLKLPNAFFFQFYEVKNLANYTPQKKNKVSPNWQLKNRLDQMFFKKTLQKQKPQNYELLI